MESHISEIRLNYKGKSDYGKRLVVKSELPISLKDAWTEVQKSSLLEFVAKGMITFKPLGGKFLDTWEEKMKVKTKMLLWGFIPFGGMHLLEFAKIDEENKVLLTHESDQFAKIWNHKISMEELPLNKVAYRDEVEIYGGALTNIITYWAQFFYRHRHKRWRLVADNVMNQNSTPIS